MTALLDDYLTRDQLADELGVAKRTLMRWQATANGLPFLELGGKILYRRSSVMKWIESRERHPNPTRKAA